MPRPSLVAAALVIPALCAAAVDPLPRREEIPHLAFENPFPVYAQQVTLRFPSVEACAAASVDLAPLFEDRPRAVSCRWDDNQFLDLEAKKLLDARGIKATWYLNANGIFYMKGDDFLPAARMLLEGGHSIGSHALSHPYITYLNRNRMFQEAAGVRIEWEAELDTLVNSHAFSFIDYRNGHEGDRSQADVIRSLERAGIYHASVFKTFDDELRSEMVLSIIMPPENQPLDAFKAAVDWAVSSEDLRERFPLISHSMHAWYGSPAVQYGWDELERRLDYLNAHTDFWQCNQNQYAAYRYQFEHTRIVSTERDGATLRVELERPVLRALNDPIPLTLRLQAADPAGVETAGTALETYRRDGKGPLLVNLPHGPGQFLPERIGRVENPQNLQAIDPTHRDPDFPGVRALLRWDGDYRLELRNESGRRFEDLVLTWRLPVAWTPGVEVVEAGTLDDGAAFAPPPPASTRSDDPALNAGSPYAVAQLDFRFGGIPSRLYLTCNVPAVRDDSFPTNAFSIMGPYPPHTFDYGAAHDAIMSAVLPIDAWTAPDGAGAKAETGRPWAAFDTSWLAPEIVPTQADWYVIHSPVYILQTVVESPVGQPFLLQCHPEDVRGAYLGNALLIDYQGTLKPGPNPLTIIYLHSGVSTPARHNAAFLRLANPETGERLANLRWRLPDHRHIANDAGGAE